MSVSLLLFFSMSTLFHHIDFDSIAEFLKHDDYNSPFHMFFILRPTIDPTMSFIFLVSHFPSKPFEEKITSIESQIVTND